MIVIIHGGVYTRRAAPHRPTKRSALSILARGFRVMPDSDEGRPFP